MQAASVSRDLKERFERILRDAREQYDLAGRAPSQALTLDHLRAAEVHYAQAWVVADLGAQLAPASSYRAWSDRRSSAGGAQKAVRQGFHNALHQAEEVTA